MKLFLHSTVIDILFSLEILFGVSFDMNMLYMLGTCYVLASNVN